MEPIRPAVDAYVLDLMDSRVFRALGAYSNFVFDPSVPHQLAVADKSSEEDIGQDELKEKRATRLIPSARMIAPTPGS